MKFIFLQLALGEWAAFIGVAITIIGAFFVIIFQLGGLFSTIKSMQVAVADIPNIKAELATIKPLVAKIPMIEAEIHSMKIEIHTMKVKVDELWVASRKQ